MAWELVAAAVSILFGVHNLFVKRAAGAVPDVVGALLVEATATAVVLGWCLATIGTWRAGPVPVGGAGAAWAALAGVFVGAASILYFVVFRLGAPMTLAVPRVLIGWVLVSVVLGVAVDGETLGARHALGIGCGALALWLLA